MHREDALPRQEVIEDRKDRLLQLTRVARAADENRAFREVDDDERARLGPMNGGIGVQLGRVQDLEARLETREIAIGRAEEHVIDEQRVPCVGCDETDR